MAFEHRDWGENLGDLLRRIMDNGIVLDPGMRLSLLGETRKINIKVTGRMLNISDYLRFRQTRRITRASAS